MGGCRCLLSADGRVERARAQPHAPRPPAALQVAQMVRDSLETHKDRHAPLLRRLGAALLWRFVVGESVGEVGDPPISLPVPSHPVTRCAAPLFQPY